MELGNLVPWLPGIISRLWFAQDAGGGYSFASWVFCTVGFFIDPWLVL